MRMRTFLELLEDCARILPSGHVRLFAWFQERVSRLAQQRDRVRLFFFLLFTCFLN